MTQQEQTSLQKLNRNVKFSPWLTAGLTALTTTIGTSFYMGKTTAEFQARLTNMETRQKESATQIAEVKNQLNVNTAEIKSLKDWRAETNKK